MGFPKSLGESIWGQEGRGNQDQQHTVPTLQSEVVTVAQGFHITCHDSTLQWKTAGSSYHSNSSKNQSLALGTDIKWSVSATGNSHQNYWMLIPTFKEHTSQNIKLSEVKTHSLVQKKRETRVNSAHTSSTRVTCNYVRVNWNLSVSTSSPQRREGRNAACQVPKEEYLHVKYCSKGLLSQFAGMVRETSTQNSLEAAHTNPLWIEPFSESTAGKTHHTLTRGAVTAQALRWDHNVRKRVENSLAETFTQIHFLQVRWGCEPGFLKKSKAEHTVGLGQILLLIPSLTLLHVR